MGDEIETLKQAKAKTKSGAKTTRKGGAKHPSGAVAASNSVPVTRPSTRQYSSLVVDGLKAAPARAMLRAVGFSDADFAKPQIGVASTWSNLTPCNMHIAELAREAAAGVDAAGAKSVLFNTITVSDGISMGKPGMRFSLVSREVIADSI